ncbi:uncharacterized protein LOC127515401 isoform X1 [Ctenopharyngodon idella]|uniref:uncharacterized protein LOC127515401 isoform X1 n=1 Tax=Ctenopharyngodon idella TaxID=7959 RepID=UPI002230991D|nr:uncharacterized protein LOC127515401 isoform X1 [Ctenopharyngodon idella]
MLHFFILMFNIPQCTSKNSDITVQNHLRIIHPGDSVTFTCILSGEIRSSVAWLRQRVGEKPLLIASIFQALDVKFENEFDKCKRFFATKDDRSFNLSLTNAEESDTATYYCVTYAYKFIFGKGTDLIVKGGELSIDSDHQRPASDPEHLEESAVALQCAVVTQSCAGEHNVYWFRHESGESPPGIIYTQERRNGQCERSSDGNSTTHKCIYNLPKNSLSHSDAGIYYCAVAACGEILFGKGREVNLPDKCFQTHWTTAALIIIILSVIVIIIMAAQLYKHRKKDEMYNTQHGQLMADDADALNYAALSFQQKPSTSRRPRERNSQDNSIYTHVR